jgi:myosin V
LTSLLLLHSTYLLLKVAFNRAEKARTLHLSASCTRIQTAWRRYARRRAYTIARAVVLVLQARARGRAARRRCRVARTLRATLRLQTFVRAAVQRRRYQCTRKAAICLQACTRCVVLRRRYQLRLRRVVRLQCLWRRRQARRQLLFLRAEAAKVSALQAQIDAFARRMKVSECLHAAVRWSLHALTA